MSAIRDPYSKWRGYPRKPKATTLSHSEQRRPISSKPAFHSRLSSLLQVHQLKNVQTTLPSQSLQTSFRRAKLFSLEDATKNTTFWSQDKQPLTVRGHSSFQRIRKKNYGLQREEFRNFIEGRERTGQAYKAMRDSEIVYEREQFYFGIERVPFCKPQSSDYLPLFARWPNRGKDMREREMIRRFTEQDRRCVWKIANSKQ